MRHISSLARPLLVALPLALLAMPGCATGPDTRPSRTSAWTTDIGSRIDRSDWMVRQGSEIWKVFEAQTVAGETRPAQHVGYLIGRDYRQGKGGPALRLYEVTGLNRKDVRGHIDSLGRVTRYEPVRNGTFTEVSLTASATREDDIGAILESPHVITLERTNERRIAFEALDTDRNGTLSEAELAGLGSRIADADTNRDKLVDFQEFDAIDAL
jgi:hypothetical protein